MITALEPPRPAPRDRSGPPVDAAPATASPAPAAAVPRSRRGRRRPPAGLVVVTLLSFGLNAWALSLNGLGNQYYAAATRSMTLSWSNFFYASLDPGGFITVDKPPVALWIAALSARVFGESTWSLLGPRAIAGAAAVALLWCIVRPRFGTVAATVAGLVLALSPVNVAVNRLNLPEPFLILFLVGAAWATLKAVEATADVAERSGAAAPMNRMPKALRGTRSLGAERSGAAAPMNRMPKALRGTRSLGGERSGAAAPMNRMPKALRRTRSQCGERRWMGWTIAAGAFVGLAFNTKMLAAYIPGPAFALALVVGMAGVSAGAWWARAKRLVVLAASTLVCSSLWILAVDVLSGSHPYIGGSTDNTVLDLVLGYNGLGRVNGGGGPGPGGGAGGGAGPGGGVMGGVGGIFGGSAGPWRLVSDAVGGQVAWLLPLAVVAAAASLWLWRRDRVRRAHVVLWAGWALLFAVVFSTAEGTFHSYYTAALVPGLAALIGIGAAAVVPLVRRSRAWLAVLGGAVGATVLLQLELAGRLPGFYGWTRGPLVLLAGTALAAVLYGLVTRHGRAVLAGAGLGLAALLVAPTAWAVSETANPVLNSTLPQAGPREGAAGSSFGSASSNGDPELAAWLEAHTEEETWALVVGSAQTASGLIADQGVSVMALGGFMGTDPTLTVDEFADLVESGAVRYVLVSGGGPGGATGGGPGAGRGGAGGAGDGSSASTILATVAEACPTVADADLPSAYAGSLHDCAGTADALRALT